MTWQYLGGSKEFFLSATPDSKVDGHAAHQQQEENSCWACCAKHCINYFRQIRASTPRIREDADLVGDVAIGEMASVCEGLTVLKHDSYETVTDEFRIPKINEIAAEIKSGRPLVINVKKARAISEKANNKATGGHWMVIIGVDAGNSKIAVFDPGDGQVQEHVWNSKTPDASTGYKGWSWQNTSYFPE